MPSRKEELTEAIRAHARVVVQWPEHTSPMYQQRALEVLGALRDAVESDDLSLAHTDLDRKLQGVRRMTEMGSVPNDVKRTLGSILRLVTAMRREEPVDDDTVAGGEALQRLQDFIDMPHMSATRVADDLLVKGDRTVRRWLADCVMEERPAEWIMRTEIIASTPDYVITKVWRKGRPKG